MDDRPPTDPWSSVRSAMGRTTPDEEPPSSPWGQVAKGMQNDRSPRRASSSAAEREPDAPLPEQESEPVASEPEPAATAPEPVEAGAPRGTGAAEDGDVGPGRRRPAPRVLASAAAAVVVAVLVVVGLVVWPGVGGSSNVALRIYGKDVTKAQVADSVTLLNKYYGYQIPAKSDTKAYKAFLSSAAKAYVIDEIVERQAAAMGITVTTAQADDNISTAELDELATARGLTLNQVQGQLRENALETKLVEKVGGTSTPTAAQINQAYAANQASLGVPETRTVSRILVSSLTTAQSLITQLQQPGASFATLAQQDSLDTATKASGGLVGTVPESAISSTAFAQAAFAAQVNVPFGPVSEGQSGGYDVGLVTAITPAAAASNDTLTQGVLTQWLAAKARSARWEAWLHGQLVKADVSYHGDYKPANPLTPPAYPVPSLTSLMASAVTQTPTASS